MNVTKDRFNNRQLHMEDYLRNRKSMQKCWTISGLLKTTTSSQTFGRTVCWNLGIPTVVDRMVQQAIAQELSPLFEEQFSDNSFGFRPKRG